MYHLLRGATLFEIRGLSKFYGKQLALKDLTLSFDKTMFVALLGRNGSGKSTLMRLLAQQDVWTEGDLLLNGNSLKSPSFEINSRMVFIDEHQLIPFDQTMEEAQRVYRALAKTYDDSLFERLCREFDLDVKKPFSQLSRGQKMKALFALQAPKRPDIYLLDEITSVLDAGSRLALMRFLAAEHARGALVIVSTNIASEMQGFATHFCFLGSQTVDLFCRTNEFNQHFRKFRLVSATETPVASAQRAHLNSDGSWSYLAPIATEVPRDMWDRREITIEDVASFYSSDRKAA